MFSQKQIKRRMHVAAQHKQPSWYWVHTPGLLEQLSLSDRMRHKVLTSLIDSAWENHDDQAFDSLLPKFAELGFTLILVSDPASQRKWRADQQLDKASLLTEGAK